MWTQILITMNQLKNLFIASALCVGVSSCSGPEKKVHKGMAWQDDLGRKDRSDV